MGAVRSDRGIAGGVLGDLRVHTGSGLAGECFSSQMNLAIYIDNVVLARFTVRVHGKSWQLSLSSPICFWAC